jgi:tRNA threonylcarbamoyladenosine biosynthesis protein TsaB
MSLILALETATSSCSVALSQDGQLIASREINERNVHASHITLFIEQVLTDAGRKIKELDAVAVSKGPGSYTGLRIGVSTAKGLCYALDIPLIAINTLEAMASGLIKSGQFEKDTLFCPMIDARRMEVFTAIYDFENNEVSPVEAKIIDEGSFSDLLLKHKIVFFGDGAAKCEQVFGENSNAVIISDFVNSAKDLTGIAFNKFERKDFEDVAYFEPYYLKDFLIIPSKKAL